MVLEQPEHHSAAPSLLAEATTAPELSRISQDVSKV
jgi:hypothetical protein